MVGHRCRQLAATDWLIFCILGWNLAGCGDAPEFPARRPEGAGQDLEHSPATRQQTDSEFLRAFLGGGSDRDARTQDPAKSGKSSPNGILSKPLLTLSTGESGPHAVAFSPDGETLAVAGQSQPVQLWNIETGRLMAAFGTDQITFDLAWSPDGRRLLASAYIGRDQLWDVRTQQPIESFDIGSVDGDQAAWSSDGKRMALSDGEDFVLCDPETGRELQRFVVPGHYVEGLAWSSDGRRLASAHYSQERLRNAISALGGELRVWDVERGTTLARFDVRSSVKCVALSPDGRTVAGGLTGLSVWDVESRQLLHELPGNARCVLFSSDGGKIVSGTGNGFKIWDLASGKAERAVVGHTDEVFGIAISPDSRRLASASYDGTVKLWDTSGVFVTQETARTKGRSSDSR